MNKIAMIEYKAEIYVREYLGFGNSSSSGFKYTKIGDKFDYIGEHNSENKPDGKGI